VRTIQIICRTSEFCPTCSVAWAPTRAANDLADWPAASSFNRLSANLYANTLRFDGDDAAEHRPFAPALARSVRGDPVVEVRNTTQRTLDANLKTALYD